MAYPPDIRQAAYELFLRGHGPEGIARQLKGIFAGKRTPSAKTLETWAYEADGEGRTWTDRKAEAEAKAREIGTRRYANQQAKMMEGILKLQSTLMEQVTSLVESGTDFDNVTQALYALVNVTKTAEKMTANKLAEEARRRDDIDHLMEALARVVPKWNEIKAEVLQEYRKLSASAA